jgi:chloramphenicol-sensitive protein RarD
MGRCQPYIIGDCLLSHRPHSTDSRAGILYAFAAYGLWGIIPLYFVALRNVSSYEILVERVLFSALLMAGVLMVGHRWGELVQAARSRQLRFTLMASALFLSANWLIYIYGVTSNQTVETSLGYFINPLLNVALGMLIFRERLRPLQIGALALATAGVVNQVVVAGHVPWIALSLAFSFGLYGLLRKMAAIDALLGLALETFVLVIPAAIGLAVIASVGGLRYGKVDTSTDLLLSASGVVTAIPLLCFGAAARRLRLSTLGFLQYLAPTVQFVLAITVLGERESMDLARWTSFVCIWVAIAIYTLDAWVWLRQGSAPPTPLGVGDRLQVVSQTD